MLIKSYLLLTMTKIRQHDKAPRSCNNDPVAIEKIDRDNSDCDDDHVFVERTVNIQK